MEELDESFQQTVKRAVAPYHPPESSEGLSMDVSFLPLLKAHHSGADVPQDQNKTFRTRLVGVWLLSNAALAISIQTLNGLDRTKQLVEACIPGNYDPYGGPDAVVVPMNGTCIEDALSNNSLELKDKQQVYFMYLLWATAGLSGVRFLGVSLARCSAIESKQG